MSLPNAALDVFASDELFINDGSFCSYELLCVRVSKPHLSDLHQSEY